MLKIPQIPHTIKLRLEPYEYHAPQEFNHSLRKYRCGTTGTLCLIHYNHCKNTWGHTAYGDTQHTHTKTQHNSQACSKNYALKIIIKLE